MTEYMILRGVNNDGWVIEKKVTARSAKSAVRELLNGAHHENEHGRYVAVPVRSWQPVTVTVETKTQLKFQ